jgi:peptidoglycan/LPS O-acetylase OafA/YrhL
LSNSAYVLFLTHFGIIVLASALWNLSQASEPVTALAMTGLAWLLCVAVGLFLHEKVEVPMHHWVAQKTKRLT